MTPLAAGLALGLLASLALNGSYLLQHAGARRAPAVTARHPLRTLRGLLRSRLWSAGLLAGLLGWGLHVGALARAPLALVQAVAAGGLALAVPAGAWLLRERLARGERIAVAAMVLALVLLAVGAHAGRVPTRVPTAPLAAFLAGAAALAAALVTPPRAARRRAAAGAGHSATARRRAAAGTTPQRLGAAAGILYGAADAATKAATIAAAHVGAAPAIAWIAAVALLSAGAFFCFQRGLQTGVAVPVIALMTAATNATAALAGLAVLGEPLGRTAALALVAIAAAAWRLAPAHARIVAPVP